MNRNKYNFIIVLEAVSCVVSGTVFYWFKNLPGIPGLISWNPQYFSVIKLLSALVLLPAVIFGGTVLFYKPAHASIKTARNAAAAAAVLSFVIGVFCAAAFAVLQFSAYKPPENIPDINLISDTSELPVKKGSDRLAKFTFSSDPHWGSENSGAHSRSSILNRINNSDTDVFFLLGDIAEMGSNPAEFKQAAQEISKKLKKVPMFAFPGNHDAMIHSLHQFRLYFSADKKPSHHFYTRLDSGPVHILVIDAMWGPEDGGSRQIKWLEKQLSSIPPQETVIVLSHCYYFSSGYIDENTKKQWYDHQKMIDVYTPLFEKYSVDLVISGHNHFMELLERNGVYYAVIGTMGGKLDTQGNYTSPASVFLDKNSFGYLDAEIKDKKLILSFIDDSGVIKHNAVIDTSRTK